MNSRLFLGGVIATTAYAALILVAFGAKVPGLLDMELNAVGDFLAGAFSPLAFLWLVLGFIQQGQELRQGTKALELQAEELKASVEQQIQMVEGQRVALANHDRALEPLLKLSIGEAEFHQGEPQICLTVLNLGEYCDSVVAIVSDGSIADRNELQALFKGESRAFYVDDGLILNTSVEISYVKLNGSLGQQTFEIACLNDEGDPYYRITKRNFLSAINAAPTDTV